jgi:hypothetical protein
MDAQTRAIVDWALMLAIGLFAVLFFFQTRDPMILIFGIIAASVYHFVRRGSRAQGTEIRVKCIACGGLNLEDAKFCSQCGRAM